MNLSPETWRLLIFIGLLAVFALAETLLPRRDRMMSRGSRWTTNVLILISGSVVLRIMGPIAALGAAAWAGAKGWGVFNLLDMPLWLEFGLALILLDLAIYVQHVATHRIPVLWRLHKVHHTDRDIDVTTALRFHPIEIALSMAYKCGVVILLGPMVFAVFAFEVLLNGLAMFNHANFKLPLGLDRLVRVLIVTPDMHRVHHSVKPSETHNNFGFCLSIWDRLFATYTAQPEAGHDGMTIGLPEYQSDKPSKLGWSLILPFR